MVSRHRSEVMSAEADTYSQVGTYTSPSGSCTASPGPCTVASGVGTKSGSFQTLYEYREMSDVVTPNFHKRRAAGEIINSPMSKTYVKETSSKLSTNFSAMAQQQGCTPLRWYDWIEHQVKGTLSPQALAGTDLFIPPPDIDITSMKDQAISSAWANIDMSEMFAIASLKELDQTIVGLADTFKKVFRIFKALRRFEVNRFTGRKGKSGIRKEFSFEECKEMYLNARYNLRPLAYDVAGAIKVLNAPLTSAMRQTFRGYSSKSVFASDSIKKYAFYHSAIDLQTTLYRSVQKEVSVRAGVLCDVQPLTMSDLLGGDEIVATAWDLVPFSFIVDWFCNAGDTIIAWSPNLRSQALASWVVTRTTTSQSTTILGSETSARVHHWTNVTGSVDGGHATKFTKTIVREPEYRRPILPSFRLKLDPLKILDLGLILMNLKGFKFASRG